MSEKDPHPQSTPAAGVSRREFVTTVAAASAAAMIVPRHVLGRGFQAPSDIVNVATVGYSGMGASNTRAILSQNLVAICDVDFRLLDERLAQWAKQAQQPPPERPDPGFGRQGGAAGEFRNFGQSKAQQAADARCPAENAY